MKYALALVLTLASMTASAGSRTLMCMDMRNAVDALYESHNNRYYAKLNVQAGRGGVFRNGVAADKLVCRELVPLSQAKFIADRFGRTIIECETPGEEGYKLEIVEGPILKGFLSYKHTGYSLTSLHCTNDN